MKAKAWVLSGPNKLEMAEFEVAPPAPDQILVKMAVTSVCATDPKMVHGSTPFKAYPIILGHELSGEVAQLGPIAAKAYGLAPGDRITIEPTRPDLILCSSARPRTASITSCPGSSRAATNRPALPSAEIHLPLLIFYPLRFVQTALYQGQISRSGEEFPRASFSLPKPGAATGLGRG